MTQPLTPTPAAPDASLGDAVLNQLLAGPTSPEVAAALLRSALKKLYPHLHLDPNNTVIGEPDWEIVDGQIVERPTRYQTLSNMLAARMNEDYATLLIEGFHFLTHLPLTTPEVHLPVRIAQIGSLINELAPVMVSACQEQQLVYWNATIGTAPPRWHELSSLLHRLWDVKQVKGWTDSDCAMARQLFLYPDLQDRKANDPYDTHAYLIDIDEVDGDKLTRMVDNSLVVLIGTVEKKQTILAYSLRRSYEKFDSLQALEQTLPDHLGNVEGKRIQWRFFEPEGNIFDHKACGLIATQVQILGSPEILKDRKSVV